VNEKMPVVLREKFGLVHVPSSGRCRRWAQRCRAQLTAGLPPERAGLIAAMEVFPYEAKEIVSGSAPDVASLLDMTD